MALPSNHVFNADVISYSPKPKSSRRHLHNMTSLGDHNSNYSTVNSAKTPSIIGLENLKLHPSEEYTVSITQSQRSTQKPLSVRSPIKAFQPNNIARWEGRKKTTVYVTVVFLKIGEIQTIKEYFEADVYIQAKWREPVLDKTQV